VENFKTNTYTKHNKNNKTPSKQRTRLLMGRMNIKLLFAQKRINKSNSHSSGVKSSLIHTTFSGTQNVEKNGG